MKSTALMASAAAMALCLGLSPAPVLADGHTASDGDWLIRLRAIAVVPDEDEDLTADLDVGIDTSVVPELDITYFFTENFAAELILATAPHEAKAGPVDLGEVWLLPPTLTAQYHFTGLGAFKPYVGAGINYTIFYNENGGDLDTTYDDAFGYALQAGIDYEVAPGYYVNADVKKIFLTTSVDVGDGAVTGDVDINPWIFGVGAGYRF